MNIEQPKDILARLERDGVVVLPHFVAGDQLQGMQRCFASMLRSQRWNDVVGFEQTELYRHMVQDVLLLDQGFVDISLDPRIKEVLTGYIGPAFQLCEAKGWLSIPTDKDFHAWHGDMWYEQSQVATVPREVKLAIYLTDVTSGAFQYLRGTHGQAHPRVYRNAEVEELVAERMLNCTGPAGTAVLFDTTGIHRQGVPMLEPRQAVFLNYHDSTLPLQAEDIEYYRYHPLLLNAAYLGNLSPEDQRILGFGDKRNYIPAFERAPSFVRFQRSIRTVFKALLWLDRVSEPVRRRLRVRP